MRMLRALRMLVVGIELVQMTAVAHAEADLAEVSLW